MVRKHSDSQEWEPGSAAAVPEVSEPTGSHGQPRGSTFGANLGAAAAEHLAPAIRRSFPQRRTQPPGTRSGAQRALRGTVAVSGSGQHSAPLRSSATSGGKGSCPCHPARSGFRSLPARDPMRQTPRDRPKRAAESSAHASAVATLGPRQHPQVKQQERPSWIVSSIQTSTCQQ
ncbi:ESX-1 secretion-associated protein EspK-like [Rattus rattus]|uniref:ESX-1 secretion-associated protein EspK-like n=1 Tax=Rattus rattus TaxID=10117 RepID=UPI0013F2FFD1|nr:ESX-1 secretion-associated protein EspK-like [Rattus rattus]